MELRTLRYYLAAAEEIVELADRLEEAFIARNADVSGVISIGATEAVGSRMFAKLIVIRFFLMPYFLWKLDWAVLFVWMEHWPSIAVRNCVLFLSVRNI